MTQKRVKLHKIFITTTIKPFQFSQWVGSAIGLNEAIVFYQKPNPQTGHLGLNIF